MPWWAIVYLIIFVILTIGGVFDDLGRPNKIIYISGEIITAVFVIVFVIGFFDESFGNALGLYVFPMLIGGVTHEILSANRTMEEVKDPEFTKNELFNLNILLLLTNLLVVPGYVFGLMVGLKNIGL